MALTITRVLIEGSKPETPNQLITLRDSASGSVLGTGMCDGSGRFSIPAPFALFMRAVAAGHAEASAVPMAVGSQGATAGGQAGATGSLSQAQPLSGTAGGSSAAVATFPGSTEQTVAGVAAGQAGATAGIKVEHTLSGAATGTASGSSTVTTAVLAATLVPNNSSFSGPITLSSDPGTSGAWWYLTYIGGPDTTASVNTNSGNATLNTFSDEMAGFPAWARICYRWSRSTVDNALVAGDPDALKFDSSGVVGFGRYSVAAFSAAGSLISGVSPTNFDYLSGAPLLDATSGGVSTVAIKSTVIANLTSGKTWSDVDSVVFWCGVVNNAGGTASIVLDNFRVTP